MDKKDIIKVLNEKRTMTFRQPKKVKVEIHETLRIAGSKSEYFLPFLSVVSLPDDSWFVINHKNLPVFYVGRVHDSFGEDYIRNEVDRDTATEILEAIRKVGSEWEKNPSLDTYSLLLGYLLPKGIHMIEDGFVKG